MWNAISFDIVDDNVVSIVFPFFVSHLYINNSCCDANLYKYFFSLYNMLHIRFPIEWRERDGKGIHFNWLECLVEICAMNTNLGSNHVVCLLRKPKTSEFSASNSYINLTLLFPVYLCIHLSIYLVNVNVYPWRPSATTHTLASQ